MNRWCSVQTFNQALQCVEQSRRVHETLLRSDDASVRPSEYQCRIALNVKRVGERRIALGVNLQWNELFIQDFDDHRVAKCAGVESFAPEAALRAEINKDRQLAGMCFLPR